MTVKAYIGYRLDWKRNPATADKGHDEGFAPWLSLLNAAVTGPRHNASKSGEDFIVLLVTGGDRAALQAAMPGKHAFRLLTAQQALTAVQAAHPEHTLSLDGDGFIAGWPNAVP